MSYINIEQKPSVNFEPRRNDQSPRYIILHYTGTLTSAEAAARFLNMQPEDSYGRLSPHYMIDEAGHITQFVQEKDRAWHAGVSYWRGETDMNSASIGIEIWNPGHVYSYPDFLPAQLHALESLCRDIMRRWNIKPWNVLGHSDIAPGRKIDPGEKFPWDSLAKAGIGVLPNPDCEQNSVAPVTEEQLIDILLKYGYSPDSPLNVLLDSFTRHFWTEKYGCVSQQDWPDILWRVTSLMQQEQQA